jgi:hypothetical protein
MKTMYTSYAAMRLFHGLRRPRNFSQQQNGLAEHLGVELLLHQAFDLQGSPLPNGSIRRGHQRAHIGVNVTQGEAPRVLP